MSDRLKHALLDLLAGRPAPDLTHSDWGAIDAMAAQHRLRPLLFARLETSDLPPTLHGQWRASARRSAMRALKQRAALTRLDRLLAKAGIDAFVLKGSAFVWQGWIDPALRPMRDIDVLVEDRYALEAHALLREAGWTGEAALALQGGKHLPGLTDTEGVLVELHTRLCDTDDPAAVRREARWREAAMGRGSGPALPGLQALSRLDDADLLLHLIVHGAIDHRFNNGPLLLLDLSLLLAHGAVDWSRFQQDSEAMQAERSVRLTLEMTRRWPLGASGGLIEVGGHEAPPLPARLVEAAATLMLVDMRRQRSLGWAGQLAGAPRGQMIARLGAMFGRARKRNLASGREARETALDPIAPWTMGALILECLKSLVNRQDRKHIRRSLDVASWLHRSGHDEAAPAPEAIKD